MWAFQSLPWGRDDVVAQRRWAYVPMPLIFSKTQYEGGKKMVFTSTSSRSISSGTPPTHPDSELQVMSPMLTVKQVSDVFFCGHVSYWSVLSMAHNDELPCIWYGRRPYFFLDSLNRWKLEQEALPSWSRQTRKKASRTSMKKVKGGAA